MKLLVALLAARAAVLALKIMHKRGSYLPGAIALKICPDILSRIAKPKIVIAVSGTNGKTTVSNMIRETLEMLGKQVASNRLGSNTSAGIATALLAAVTLGNKCRFEYGVFEVDERFSPQILPNIHAQVFAITNLFRDSIMRNAHPEFIKSFLDRAVPEGTTLVLNADDPISSAVSPDSERVYFGLDKMETDVIDCVNLIDDFRVCRKCGSAVVYDYRRYHHIGKCRCTSCDYASPEAAVIGQDVDTVNMKLTISDGETREVFSLPNDSIFNIYNVVTAVAVLRQLGFSLAELAQTMRRIKITETRFSITEQNGIRVIMQMSKDRNALASSRAFDYVSSRPGRKELILMMNNYTDEKKWSENTCWLYDCDFEFLNKPEIERIISTGPRGLDYNLRCRLAGINPEILYNSRLEENAPKLLSLSGADVYILYGTDGIDIANKVREAVFAESRRRAGEGGKPA